MRGGAAGRSLSAIHLALFLANVAVYHRVATHPFLHDDHRYLLENPPVREGLSWKGVRWAFSTPPGMPWHPLTWVSHMADCQWFGLDAGAHHLVNLALHSANTALLFELLRRLAGGAGRSALAAALFALHPLHVESVAWVAGRKDLLAALFAFGTLLAYAAYARSQRPALYAAALLLFVLGLLAKPVLVGLPLLLIVLDRWPLRRNASWRARWLEKTPFLAVASVAGILTRRSIPSALVPADISPRDWMTQAAGAAELVLRYAGRTLWPRELAVTYTTPELPEPAEAAGALLAVAAITTAVVALRHRAPVALLGWSWFLVFLAPVVGLVPGGPAAFADRYAYLPIAGLFVALTWGGATFARGWPVPLRSAAAGGALLALGAVSGGQLALWHDAHSLYAHAVSVSPRSPAAHHDYGVVLAQEEKMEDAAGHFAEAIRLEPSFALPYQGLAALHARAGRLEEAEGCYRRALGLRPDLQAAEYDLGAVLVAQGRTAEAIELYRGIVRKRPDFLEARNNLAVLLLAAGRREETEAQRAELMRFGAGARATAR